MTLGSWHSNLCSQGSEVWEVFVVELLESPRVLAVGDEPVDGWEMFPLGQLLFQTPKHLYNTQCGRGHRVREVTTRGRHTKWTKRSLIYTVIQHTKTALMTLHMDEVYL